MRYNNSLLPFLFNCLCTRRSPPPAPTNSYLTNMFASIEWVLNENEASCFNVSLATLSIRSNSLTLHLIFMRVFNLVVRFERQPERGRRRKKNVYSNSQWPIKMPWHWHETCLNDALYLVSFIVYRRRCWNINLAPFTSNAKTCTRTHTKKSNGWTRKRNEKLFKW